MKKEEGRIKNEEEKILLCLIVLSRVRSDAIASVQKSTRRSPADQTNPDLTNPDDCASAFARISSQLRFRPITRSDAFVPVQRSTRWSPADRTNPDPTNPAPISFDNQLRSRPIHSQLRFTSVFIRVRSQI
uniref:Uncharacterized protein n=1 Tax=Cucumis sativus TaxID=3659 RepID=A0A0A0KCU8_CUCSA